MSPSWLVDGHLTLSNSINEFKDLLLLIVLEDGKFFLDVQIVFLVDHSSLLVYLKGQRIHLFVQVDVLLQSCVGLHIQLIHHFLLLLRFLAQLVVRFDEVSPVID